MTTQTDRSRSRRDPGVPRLGPGVRLLRALALGRALPLVAAPLVVVGAARLPERGPLLLVANHASHLDAPAILAALPTRLRDRTLVAAAEDYFFRGRLRGAAVALFGAFPFARQGAVGRIRSGLDRVVARLAAGWSVLLFPEGTRSRDGRPGRFLPGAIGLAARSGATIVPVGLVGCHAAWPPGGRPRRGPVAVRFGQPWIVPPGCPARAAAAALGDAVAALVAEQDQRVRGWAGGRRAPVDRIAGWMARRRRRPSQHPTRSAIISMSGVAR